MVLISFLGVVQIKISTIRNRRLHCIFDPLNHALSPMPSSASPDLHWTFLPFEALSPEQLYALLRLRSEVFVVEQNCVFLDMDNLDSLCQHLLGYTAEGELAVYARIVPAGVTFEHASIGRVVGSPRHRGLGLGRALMKKAIEALHECYGPCPIQIGAQLYLKAFYESFGFRACSEVYLEDGIEHIEMVRDSHEKITLS